MPNYNRVLLMGNITRDIELKFTAGNQPVAQIGLAINRRFRTKEGENREEVTFVDCEAWGKTAEIMKQYLGKGRPVFIEGRLKLDQWQDKDGGKRSKLKVVVETFSFIDSRQGASGGGGAPADSGGGRQYDAPVPAGGGHEAISEDDIPF